MSVTPGTDARRSLSVMAPDENIWSRSQCHPLAPISVERGVYGRAIGVLIVSRGGRGVGTLEESPAEGGRFVVSAAARFVVSVTARLMESARAESGRGGVACAPRTASGAHAASRNTGSARAIAVSAPSPARTRRMCVPALP